MYEGLPKGAVTKFTELMFAKFLDKAKMVPIEEPFFSFTLFYIALKNLTAFSVVILTTSS